MDYLLYIGVILGLILTLHAIASIAACILSSRISEEDGQR